MWTCNRLDLVTLRSQPVMSKNLPDQCLRQTHWAWKQWSGRFLGISGWDPGLSKSNWLEHPHPCSESTARQAAGRGLLNCGVARQILTPPLRLPKYLFRPRIYGRVVRSVIAGGFQGWGWLRRGHVGTATFARYGSNSQSWLGTWPVQSFSCHRVSGGRE